jgi:hypothetical protein
MHRPAGLFLIALLGVLLGTTACSGDDSSAAPPPAVDAAPPPSCDAPSAFVCPRDPAELPADGAPCCQPLVNGASAAASCILCLPDGRQPTVTCSSDDPHWRRTEATCHYSADSP